MSVNKVMLVGRLGAAPRLSTTKNGTKFATFSVVTNEYYRDTKGERKEVASWHRVYTFGPLAEACAKALEKGRQVYVEGKNNPRKWTDKNNVERYNNDIVATRIQFLGKSTKTTASSEALSISREEFERDESAFIDS